MPIPDHLARQAEADPTLLAGCLAAYAQAHNLDHAGLATAVGCDPAHLNRLKLCRRPRPNQLDADIQTIAAYVPCDATLLRAVLDDPATVHPGPATSA